MSFLATVDMDPHIHLLQLDPHSPDYLQQRIYYLAKTRRFDELLEAAQKLPNTNFPTLHQNIESARRQTEQERKQLNEDSIDELVAKMDQDSQDDEADGKLIDEGQMKIYRLAKLYYDEGHFQQAEDLIKRLESQSLNDELYIKTTWARLYCEVLLQSPKARNTVERLRRKIGEAEEGEREELGRLNKEKVQIGHSQRVYARKEELLNLAILVFLKESGEEDLEKLVDLCTSKDFFAVVQMVCPHALRYLCVCYILNKSLHRSRQYDLFMLLEIIRRKVVKYEDPFVQFLEGLHIEFAFADAAQNIEQLRLCAQSDPLIRALAPRLVQNCYFLYYKVYCKVHERVPIAQIAEFTGKSAEEAELWVLGLIRSLDIDAKIDSVEMCVVSSKEEESLNEKYMELLPKARSFISDLQSNLA